MPAPVNPGPKQSMVHLNGHILCAIDTETTGLRPRYHEIVQLALLPLDARLNPLKDVPHFDILIKPEYPNRIEKEAVRKIGQEKWNMAITMGIPREAAVDLFEEWFFYKLGIADGKRITPLAQNWKFDYEFLDELFGWELRNERFDSRSRDTFTVAQFLNDQADFDAEKIPFPDNQQLSNLARRLNIEVESDMTHDALYDCHLTAKVYKAMVLEPRL